MLRISHLLKFEPSSIVSLEGVIPQAFQVRLDFFFGGSFESEVVLQSHPQIIG